MEVKVKKIKIENLDQLKEFLTTLIEDINSGKLCDCNEVPECKITKEARVLCEALDNLKDNLSCSNMIDLEAILTKVASFNKGAALSLVLREIALVLDKQYEDNIRECEEVYGLSFVTGKIVKVPKKVIRGYSGFAAFRTMEDAKLACKILKDILKDMFGGK